VKPRAARAFGARPLTASSTVASISRYKPYQQRSEEFSTETSGEISTGIDSNQLKSIRDAVEDDDDDYRASPDWVKARQAELPLRAV
jgi:hypothetical protein